MSPLISVCIPVYCTEPFLAQCLRSVIAQDFGSFEVVVVSDASRGKDSSGRSAKKIVRLAQKECCRLRKEKKLPPVKFTFIENSQNRGIIEVRRTLVNAADGIYIAMLDSDDVMEEGSLSVMYEAAGVKEDGNGTYDIIQGCSTAGSFGEDGSFKPASINLYSNITTDELNGHDIFNGWLMHGKFSGVLWGKLIKRTLFVKSFEYIPYTECSMGEDFLLTFYLSLNAEKYIGIKDKVYLYRITDGISSSRKIDSLQRWKMICSSSSIFSIVSTWLEENKNAVTAFIFYTP